MGDCVAADQQRWNGMINDDDDSVFDDVSVVLSQDDNTQDEGVAYDEVNRRFNP